MEPLMETTIRLHGYSFLCFFEPTDRRSLCSHFSKAFVLVDRLRNNLIKIINFIFRIVLIFILSIQDWRETPFQHMEVHHLHLVEEVEGQHLMVLLQLEGEGGQQQEQPF
jgi:hypothetical protein